MRVLRINTVTSDGKPAHEQEIPFHPLDPETGKPYVDDDGQVCVELILRPIPHAVARRLEQECVEHVPDKGTTVERIDWDLVRDAKVCYAVVRWSGFVGADDRPVPCIDPAKRALDVFLKNEIVARASTTQPVEVTAASFRESARVPEVVLGLRSDGHVLPAR